MTPPQLKSALRALAHYHALGYGWVKENGGAAKIEARYPFLSQFFGQIAHNEMLVGYMNGHYAMFLRDLEGTEHAALIPRFAVLADKTPGLFTGAMAREERFLVHGDAWMNNLLFAEEENVSVIGSSNVMCT